MKPVPAAARSSAGTGTSTPCHGAIASALAGSTSASVIGGGSSRRAGRRRPASPWWLKWYASVTGWPDSAFARRASWSARASSVPCQRATPLRSAASSGASCVSEASASRTVRAWSSGSASTRSMPSAAAWSSSNSVSTSVREPVARPGPAAEGAQAGVVDVDDDDVVARRGHRRQRGGLAHVVERELQAGQRRDRRDDHVPGAEQPQQRGDERHAQRRMPALEALQRALPDGLAGVRIGGGAPPWGAGGGRRFPVGRWASRRDPGRKAGRISSGRTASACRPGR